MNKKVVIILKRIIVIGIALVVIILIFVVAFFLIPQKVSVSIVDIAVKNHIVDNSDVEIYGVESSILYDDNVNLKEVELICNIKNKSAKDMYGIWATFNTKQKLPTVICGDKFDTKRPDSIRIKPFESKQVKFYFLVNADAYSDETILQLISNVEFCIIKDGNPGSTQGVIVSDYLKISKQ